MPYLDYQSGFDPDELRKRLMFRDWSNTGAQDPEQLQQLAQNFGPQQPQPPVPDQSTGQQPPAQPTTQPTQPLGQVAAPSKYPQQQNPYLPQNPADWPKQPNFPQISIDPTESVKKYQTAADALAAMPRERTPGEKDPATNQPYFPRNKVLGAVLAPFVFKQILRNPQQGMAAYDFLTRKGWAGYSSQYQNELASKERNFQVERDVAKANTDLWEAGLRGSNNALEWQSRAATLFQNSQMFPIERDIAIANLEHVQQQTNAEKWDTNPWQLMTPNGPVTALLRRPVNPNEKPEFFNLSDMNPITKFSNPSRMAATGEQTLDKMWLMSREREALAKNEPLDKAFYDKAEKDLQDIKGAEPYQRLLAQQQETEKGRQYQTQANAFKTAASDFRKVLDATDIPLSTQRIDIDQAKQALMTAKEAAKTGQMAGVSAWGGNVKAVLSSVGGIRPVSRYTIAEIESPTMQASAIQRAINTVSNWFGNPSGTIPMEAIDQLLTYTSLMDMDTQLIEGVISKYKGEVVKNSKTNNVDAMEDIESRYKKDLDNVKAMEPKNIPKALATPKNLPEGGGGTAKSDVSGGKDTSPEGIKKKQDEMRKKLQIAK